MLTAKIFGLFFMVESNFSLADYGRIDKIHRKNNIRKISKIAEINILSCVRLGKERFYTSFLSMVVDACRSIDCKD